MTADFYQKAWRPEERAQYFSCAERKELLTQNSISRRKLLGMTGKSRQSQMEENQENPLLADLP